MSSRRSRDSVSAEFFRFWRNISSGANIHPQDRRYLNEETDHGFQLGFVPKPWYGPIKRAKIVFAFVNPGLSKWDYREAKSGRLRRQITRQRDGNQPLAEKDEHLGRGKWVASRLKRIGEYADLRHCAAVIELFPYHSKTFGDHGLANILPSAQIARRYLKEVLVPEAKARKRFLIIARARRLWGISRADECHTLRILENRGGYPSCEVAKAAKRWLEKRFLISNRRKRK